MMLGQLSVHVKKNKIRPIPYPIYIQLKINHRPKCKSYVAMKPLEENEDINLSDLGLENGFLATTPKD